jgi:predicted ester cyclase
MANGRSGPRSAAARLLQGAGRAHWATVEQMDTLGRGRRRHAVAVIALVTVLAVAACGGVATILTNNDNSSNGPGNPTATGADLVDRNDGLVVPALLHVAPGTDSGQAERVVHTAQLLYTFWNTGDASYLDQSITPSFRDNTLPIGRPQGPDGPRIASATFRTAVPDLSCRLVDLYITGDAFTARLVFQGHFTGTYNGIQGHGQNIDFNAIDIQHTGADTRITEDWHLEDNLTFLQQAGLVTVASS